MKPRLWIGAGVVLVTISVIGLILAIGNLASLPSIQEQLRNFHPEADAAISMAVAQSREKSYIGIGIFLATLGCGLLLVKHGRRSNRDLA